LFLILTFTCLYCSLPVVLLFAFHLILNLRILLLQTPFLLLLLVILVSFFILLVFLLLQSDNNKVQVSDVWTSVLWREIMSWPAHLDIQDVNRLSK
jgi:hypothetical protein